MGTALLSLGWWGRGWLAGWKSTSAMKTLVKIVFRGRWQRTTFAEFLRMSKTNRYVVWPENPFGKGDVRTEHPIGRGVVDDANRTGRDRASTSFFPFGIDISFAGERGNCRGRGGGEVERYAVLWREREEICIDMSQGRKTKLRGQIFVPYSKATSRRETDKSGQESPVCHGNMPKAK
ncbi:hypothetical protein B0J14DRAFT_206819 [Halenospora varia]|nr:hypothetical protein B0J14DRAFT_206819 [Halenospora varia]